MTPGTCYGFGITYDRTFFILHTTFNMVFDIMVLAIPVPLYWQKDTAFRKRMGMTTLFLLGAL